MFDLSYSKVFKLPTVCTLCVCGSVGILVEKLSKRPNNIAMRVSSSQPRDNAHHVQESVNANGNDNGRSSFRRARGQVDNTLRDLGGYLPLYKAAIRGEWRDARNFFDHDPEALTAKITIASETALHIAVGTGQPNDFVEKLVREMTPENLALTDQHGETALSIAAVVGNIVAAKILVNKNPDLPNISGKYGFPIHKAARFGHKDMVRYLHRVTRPDIESNPFTGKIGGRLLIDVIAAEFYDIALTLVNRYPEIATEELNGLGSPLSVLATKSSTFSTGRRWFTLTWKDLLEPVKCYRKAREKKLMKPQALELVKVLCKEILELDDAKVFSLLQKALHQAAKLGIPEIIEEIVEAFPPAIWFTDQDNYNVIQLAVLNRREGVFKLIHQMTEYKNLMTWYSDAQDNNILHLAGRLPPTERLRLASGPAFQAQREMKWFKQVTDLMQPAQREAKNKEGKTPYMVFREEHEELMERGAKWMKKTATSYTVVAALIATIAFTGAMHVSDNSLKLITGQIGFNTFVAANTVSLVGSVTSVLSFLSIITSESSEIDFLKVLPSRLRIGLIILMVSIISLVIQFAINFYYLAHHINRVAMIITSTVACSMFSYGLWPLFDQILLRPYRSKVVFGKKSRRGIFGKKKLRILH